MELKPAKLQELLWEDVKHEVKTLDADLFEAIEEFGPTSQHTLFKVTYPYGAEILRDGILQLPTPDGKIAPIDDASIPERTRELLNYNNSSNPVTLVLKNSIELFALYKQTIIPMYGIVPFGSLFGSSFILSDKQVERPHFIWNMTSGARSIFMLAKLFESNGFNRLHRMYQLKSQKPAAIFEHWHLFKELANSPNVPDWNSEMLFFSKAWFDWSNNKLNKFRIYLFEKAWKATEFWRNQIIWSLVHSIFQEEKLVKVNPYIADITKHLIGIGIGANPAFAPAISDLVAPIKALQKIFVEVYQLEYAPIIMKPSFLYEKDVEAVYYSAEFPTASEFSPHTKQAATKISDLYDIKEMLKKFFNFIGVAHLNIEDTRVFTLKENVTFDFFHPQNQEYKDIMPVEELFSADTSFINSVNSFKNLPLPVNASFLKGCIRIRKKEDK